MNKTTLIPQITAAHQSLWETARKIPNELTNNNQDGKWSVNENLDHINKSLLQQTKFFSVPKTSIGLKYGLANRASVSYESLKVEYKTVIASLKGEANSKNLSKFTPEPNAIFNSDELILDGQETLQKMIEAIQNWSDQQLDLYFCPHPALGNITVRELLYFIIIHTQHHEESIQRKFTNTNPQLQEKH
ncbi:DinB family protein [Flavobacterium sp.]|uniref:DinB family protein n=1 Tax=Flavobacterium sp. TaxID=239 RepID=UPI00286D5502|nr:DinB family protein [Flavobacterium sp.]